MSTRRPCAEAWRAGAARCLGLVAAAPQPDDHEIRKRLKDILSRPEFAPDKENWLQRFFAWFAEFFHSLGGLNETAPVFYWVLLIGCVLLLVVLLGHIGWTIKRGVFAVGPEMTDDARQAKRALLSLNCWEQAQRCAAQQQFTEAIRFLFLSLVYRFDESGKVNFRQAYTNREYLALFGDRPPVYDKLKVFVDTLDDYWYAQRATDQTHYESCLALYQGLTSS